MVKAHEIKLYPTKRQERLLRQSCGVARFAFNWALAKWKEDYKNGVKQSAYTLIKHLNSIKRTEFAWMQETSKTCSQYAIHHVESAFKKMWKEKSGYPNFKKKGVKDSFVAVENKNSFKQKDKKIWLPRIGLVRCSEDLRFDGKVNNVTVKRIADMYFSVVNIETYPNEMLIVSENQATVGVDLGINGMMILSDGIVFENQKALRKNMKGIKRLQRGLSRKRKGSNNRKKQKMKVAKRYYRISCIRKNAIHQATSYIVKHYDKIVIEDLNVKRMVKNHKLAQSLNDVSFGEISRQLAYKAMWKGKELVKADRYFASSKTCSHCGHKKEKLELSERVFKCESCGFKIDRDLNAAINLANYGSTSKFEGTKACGADPNITSRNRVALKQEINRLSNKIVQNCTLS